MKPIVPLLLFMSLVPGIVAAQEVELYSGAVPVEDRSQSAREAAFPRALEQVLGKLSGLRDLADDAMVRPVVQNARSLVVSFHYEQRVSGDEEPGEFATPAEHPQQAYLVAQFSRSEVDDILHVLGLPRWPPARDSLEVWLLIDDGQGRRVMPLEYEYLRSPIERVARLRGLPLDWPEAAEGDDYGVDVQLLWGGYTETLWPDGSPGNVLVIAARREGPEWNVRLILEYGGEHWTWRSRQLDLRQALKGAMHQVIDEIAAAQAIAPSDQGKWVYSISVSGMQSGEDYARCLAYLESLSVVEDVSIEEAGPSGVQMALTLNAAPEYFEQAVAGGKVLEYAQASGQYVLQR